MKPALNALNCFMYNNFYAKSTMRVSDLFRVVRVVIANKKRQ